MYALIQDDDTKSQNLAKEMPEIELYRVNGSTNKIPLLLIKQIIKRRKKPKAVILRYLNDSTSFIKSIIRFITNLVTVFLSKLLGVRLIWICHNVDKESKEYFPYLVRLRRKIVTKFSDKILVTDKLLIKHAAKILKVNEAKIDFITFGNPSINQNHNTNDLGQEIIEFIQKNNNENTLFGLSIGNPNKKVLQPFYTIDLIEKAIKFGVDLKIILGGPLSDFIKKHDMDTYKKLIDNPNVLFLDGKVKVNESYISQFIDFYWRVYDDYSVPFTVYNAAYLKKPILTMGKGFLSEMVFEYELGSILENNMSNVVNAIKNLEKDRTRSYDQFTETHNWSIGAKQLYKIIISE
ncbi:hypothetical protein [Oceanobacillus picturae]|uniref:hypothetical protein n=1 Tax=Oceanobacillus picturae TaxID=171693 RepID=UPI00362F8D46